MSGNRFELGTDITDSLPAAFRVLVQASLDQIRQPRIDIRRKRGDLRIASGSPATPGERARRSEPSTRGTPSSGRGSPFEEIDVPEWVAPEE